MLLPVGLVAQDQKKWELKGYVRDVVGVSFLDDAASMQTLNYIHNRLDFRYGFTERFTVKAGLRTRLFFGEAVRTTPGFGEAAAEDPGYFNLTSTWVDEESIVAVSGFDRLYADYSTAKFAARVGRQRINWSMNVVWNPNDLFNAYNVLDPDYEERPGADAVRVQWFTGAFTQLEGAYRFAEDKDEMVLALLYKTNKWKYDWQFLGGMFQSDYVIGGGFAGPVGEMGLKGEASCFIPDDTGIDEPTVFVASAGVDYAFKNNWTVIGSFLYQSERADTRYWSGVLTGSTLSPKQLMPFRWSFYGSAMKAVNPLFTITAAAIYSPENHTLIAYPMLGYSITNDFDMDLAWQGVFSDITGDYRTDGNYVQLRIRWSF